MGWLGGGGCDLGAWEGGRAAAGVGPAGQPSALYHRVHRMYAETFDNVFSAIDDEFGGVAVLRVQCRVKGHSWKLWHRQVGSGRAARTLRWHPVCFSRGFQ